MKFGFKDKYTTIEPSDISSYPTTFRAYLANGDGSRVNPANASSFGSSQNNYTKEVIVVGGGRFSMAANIFKEINVPVHIIGQGIGKTIVDCFSDTAGYQQEFWTCFFKDITFNSATLKATTGWNKTGRKSFSNCEFNNQPVILSGNCYFINNIYHYIPTDQVYNVSGRNTFVGAVGTPLNLQQQLYHKCKVNLAQSHINGFQANYTAFNDCEFKIGAEVDYKPLGGNTPEELRNSFVERCQEQNITLNLVTESGDSFLQGRWVFTKKSILENVTYKNSDLHQFELKRGTVFGLYSERFDRIAVSTQKDKANTFIVNNASPGLLFNENSISLDNSIDTTYKHVLKSTSKVICWGERRELRRLSVPNNLKKEYGVLLDSQCNLDLDNGILPGQEKIEKDEIYIVRSTDKQPATLSYNKAIYSTDIGSSACYFRGVSDGENYTALMGNPIVYKVNDLLQYQTIEMRIVDKIPPQVITNGDLLKGYWYIVEHDNDQSNATDYIEYDGVRYKVYDSFLVKDSLTFKRSGNIHLRRCFKEDFDFNTETVDKDFWSNKQKPQWFHVLPEDTRCLMKDNAYLSTEMASDEDGYITSGHPAFYKNIKLAGNDLPYYYIKGVYMQFRLVLSTQNIINTI